MRRILRKLIRGEIIESKEGVNGGVRLSVDAKNISVRDIVKIIQGEIKLIECVFRNKICENRKKCVLRKKLSVIENNMIKQLKKLTINELIN